MSPAADKGALAFAEKLLGLLGEGKFTATYKYAVILGLMDLCLEESTRSGSAPTSVTTHQLAEKIVELYWTHTLPFDQGMVLKQSSGGQAAILRKIEAFKQATTIGSSISLHQARSSDQAKFTRLLKSVEWVLVEMPLPKLQRFGRDIHPFIYAIEWDDAITAGQFNSPSFDNVIRFTPNAGDYLVRLGGLIRPIVQREWTERVARMNKAIIKDSELEDFLFGTSRIALNAVRSDLRKLQNSRCFYCQDALSSKNQVDHFVPWARYPNNGITNLVLTHGRCNGDKRDHLAAAEHVERWMERSDRQFDDLQTIAANRGWEHHPERTVSVARSIYLRLPEDARLWQEVGEFAQVDRPRLAGAFS